MTNTVFEVGGTYGWYDAGFDPITVLSRTPKTITVTNGVNEWRMLVRRDGRGCEYVIDSSVPTKWRDAFTSYAIWRIEQ